MKSNSASKSSSARPAKAASPVRSLTQPKEQSSISKDVNQKPNGQTPAFSKAFTATSERQAGEQAAATQGAPQAPGTAPVERPDPIRTVNGRTVNEAADWVKRDHPNKAIDDQARKFQRDGHKVSPTTPEAVNQRHTDSRPGEKGGADTKFKANQIEVGKKGLDGVRVTPFKPDGRPGAADFFATNRELAQAGQDARNSRGKLTPAQVLQDRLALPTEPKFATPTHAAPGTKIDQSVVGEQKFNGQTQKGGGLQLKALDPLSSLDPKKALDVNRTARQLATAGEIASTAKGLGKVLKPVGIATDALQLGEAFQKDGGTIGRNTAKAATEIGASWGGAVAGAKLGALGGAAIGSVVPVVGTAIGGVVGGIAGGIVGGLTGGAVGRWIGSFF
ncbi:MAG: hypothetical protein KIS61_13755 [Candidatus Eremiobacteraeota bacterium]|nr:hypothetical protein [Candidatus Eremiobacteraeota bacterium]